MTLGAPMSGIARVPAEILAELLNEVALPLASQAASRQYYNPDSIAMRAHNSRDCSPRFAHKRWYQVKSNPP